MSASLRVTDPLLEALAVVCRADDVSATDDGIAFRVPTPDAPAGWVACRLGWDVFDALVEKGWVELLGADEFQVTQGGKYWYDRWERAEARVRRKKGG